MSNKQPSEAESDAILAMMSIIATTTQTNMLIDDLKERIEKYQLGGEKEEDLERIVPSAMVLLIQIDNKRKAKLRGTGEMETMIKTMKDVRELKDWAKLHPKNNQQ